MFLDNTLAAYRCTVREEDSSMLHLQRVSWHMTVCGLAFYATDHMHVRMGDEAPTCIRCIGLAK